MKMKKIIALLGGLLLLSFPLAAEAKSSEVKQVPNEHSIDVYVNYVSNKTYYEIVMGVDNMESVKLPNGAVISGKSSTEEDQGLRVIIIPVTADDEAEAYAWMSGEVKNIGENPTAYYLAFYKGNDPAQPKGEIMITITSVQGTNSPSATDLYYMNGEAKLSELSYTAENYDSVTFKMDLTGYYLSVKTEKTPEPVPVIPKTGDNSNITLFLLLMAISIVVLLFLCKKREEQNDKKVNPPYIGTF